MSGKETSCGVSQTFVSVSYALIIRSVQSLSCVWLFVTPWTAARQGVPINPQLLEHARTHVHRVSDATTSSSVIPFSSCLISFPASGSFPISQVFESGGQSIGVSASASVLPMDIQDWSPLGWTSLQSKGLLRVFYNITVQKHQFFGTQLSLQSNSHIYSWPLEKP